MSRVLLGSGGETGCGGYIVEESPKREKSIDPCLQSRARRRRCGCEFGRDRADSAGRARVNRPHLFHEGPSGPYRLLSPSARPNFIPGGPHQVLCSAADLRQWHAGSRSLLGSGRQGGARRPISHAAAPARDPRLCPRQALAEWRTVVAGAIHAAEVPDARASWRCRSSAIAPAPRPCPLGLGVMLVGPAWRSVGVPDLASSAFVLPTAAVARRRHARHPRASAPRALAQVGDGGVAGDRVVGRRSWWGREEHSIDRLNL